MSQTVLEKFDDYARKVQAIIQADCTNEFLTFVRNQNQCRLQWKEAVEECQRLRGELDRAVKQISDSDRKLNRAREILGEQKARAEAAELERDKLNERLQEIFKMLEGIWRSGDPLANETRERLDRFMSETGVRGRRSTGDGLYPRLDTIDEGTASVTGDLLSDLTLSRSDDTLSSESSNRSARRKSKRPRKSDPHDEFLVKRRRSSRLAAIKGKEQVVATTTVTMPPDGPIIAKSRIETRPVAVRRAPEPPKVFVTPSAPPLPSSSESDGSCDFFTKPHNFQVRTVLKPVETCCACNKGMGFATKVARCTECKYCAHLGCQQDVPLPCMPVPATPRAGRGLTLAQHVGPTPPFIPPIVVRCVLAVESKGFTEVGLYRVSASKQAVEDLIMEFQKTKGAVKMEDHDVHVICSVLKEFFRSLPERLISYKKWSRYNDAVKEAHDCTASLYQLVSELPPPNRDTLAFIMLHLLKVAQSTECKMNAKNLSIVFGPTLLGSSSSVPSVADLDEAPVQAMVVERLMDLGEDYWRNVMHTVTPATPVMTPKYAFRARNASKQSRLFGTPGMN